MASKRKRPRGEPWSDAASDTFILTTLGEKRSAKTSTMTLKAGAPSLPANPQSNEGGIVQLVADNTGRKDDTGKPGFRFLPWDALSAINTVLVFGAKKYAARNWEQGMDWSRPWEACLRHLHAWHNREPSDPETGLSHLAHAGCCILFLIAYELRGVGNDDRLPAPPPPVAK